MFAQLLEARGIEVDRRPGLGATEIAFRRHPHRLRRRLPRVHRHRAPRDSRRAAGARSAEGVRPGEPRVPPALERPLASAAGVREHLRHRGAAGDRGAIRPRHAERPGAGGTVAPRGTHARLHRPARRAPRAHPRLRRAIRRSARAPSRREVPGAGRGRGGRDRRLLHRRPDRALRSRGAAGRQAVLSALRGGRAGERRAGRAAAGRDRRADRAEQPSRRDDDAAAQPAARGGSRAGRPDRGRRAGGAGAHRARPRGARRRSDAAERGEPSCAISGSAAGSCSA